MSGYLCTRLVAHRRRSRAEQRAWSDFAHVETCAGFDRRVIELPGTTTAEAAAAPRSSDRSAPRPRSPGPKCHKLGDARAAGRRRVVLSDMAGCLRPGSRRPAQGGRWKIVDAFRLFGAWRDTETLGAVARFPRPSPSNARYRRLWTLGRGRPYPLDQPTFLENDLSAACEGSFSRKPMPRLAR